MHRHPDDQTVAGGILEAQGDGRDDQLGVLQHRLVALRGCLHLTLPRLLALVAGIGHAGIGQRLEPQVLRPFTGDQEEQDAAGQHQQYRQAEDPAPLQLQHFEDDDGGHVGQDRGAACGEHIEAVDLAALRDAPPVRQQAAAGRPAERLEVAVDAPGQDQAHEATGETGDPVGAAGQHRPQGHDAAAAELVGQVAVDRLADGVGPEHRSGNPAEGFLAQAELGLHAGDGEPEGLPAGVEEQVAEHRGQQHAPLGHTKRWSGDSQARQGISAIHGVFLLVRRPRPRAGGWHS
ncbi:hypothetical protein D3C80_1045480 [compost metagenome]